MPKIHYAPIWADPMWDCERTEILPEDDEALFLRCDHCDAVGRFERRAACECRGLWCKDHAPFRHPDDDFEPWEIVPYRHASLRQLLRNPHRVIPRQPSRVDWDVSDLANLSTAIACVYRRYDRSQLAPHFDIEAHAGNSFGHPGAIELPHCDLWQWL